MEESRLTVTSSKHSSLLQSHLQIEKYILSGTFRSEDCSLPEKTKEGVREIRALSKSVVAVVAFRGQVLDSSKLKEVHWAVHLPATLASFSHTRVIARSASTRKPRMGYGGKRRCVARGRCACTSPLSNPARSPPHGHPHTCTQAHT